MAARSEVFKVLPVKMALLFLSFVFFFFLQQFKKNLKGVNGNKDFDQDMLEDIYTAIK